MTIAKIKCDAVLLDEEKYMRQKIDDVHVGRIRGAIKSDPKKIPRPIVEQLKDGTFRVVDGTHRITAYIRELGSECEIKMEVRTYTSESDRIMDAIGDNGTHGLQFSVYDTGRVLRMAREASMDMFAVYAALGFTREAADRIIRRSRPVVLVEGAKTDNPDEVFEATVKTGFKKLENQKSITKDQFAAMDQGLGVHPLRLVNDLTARIKGDCIEYTVDLVFAFKQLRDLLDESISGKFEEVTS